MHNTYKKDLNYNNLKLHLKLIKKLIAKDKSALVNPLVCYTLNRMPNGDDKAPHLVRN